MAKRKSNYKAPYDDFYITKFRVERPAEVDEIRREVREKYPFASTKTIEKYVDQEILPSILEEPIKNYGGGDVVHFGKLRDIDKLSFEDIFQPNDPEAHFKLEMLDGLMGLMIEEDREMLKMFFGLDPHTKVYTHEEIGIELGIPRQTISYRIGKNLEYLRESMEEIEGETEVE